MWLQEKFLLAISMQKGYTDFYSYISNCETALRRMPHEQFAYKSSLQVNLRERLICKFIMPHSWHRVSHILDLKAVIKRSTYSEAVREDLSPAVRRSQGRIWKVAFEPMPEPCRRWHSVGHSGSSRYRTQ